MRSTPGALRLPPGPQTRGQTEDSCLAIDQREDERAGTHRTPPLRREEPPQPHLWRNGLIIGGIEHDDVVSQLADGSVDIPRA